MLKKLLKYEFRAMGKEFFYLWFGVLALAIVNRFVMAGPLISGDVSDEMQSLIIATHSSSTLLLIFMMAFMAVMIAMFVITLIFIIRRFFNGLLGTEGYLMNTLPVNTWQLILSKLLCAVTLNISNVIVATLAVLILIPNSTNFFRELLTALQEPLEFYGSSIVILVPTIIIASLAGVFQNYLHLYLAMSLGHLSSKHRVAMSVVAYIGINIVGSTVINILAPVLSTLNAFTDFFSRNTPLVLLILLWASIFGSLIISGLYFFISNRILSENLNLE